MRWSKENKNFFTPVYQGLQCFYFGEQILEEATVNKIKLALLLIYWFHGYIWCQQVSLLSLHLTPYNMCAFSLEWSRNILWYDGVTLHNCHLVSIFLSLINELQKQTQGKSKDTTEFDCIGPQSLCWSPRIKITSAYAYLLNCIKGIWFPFGLGLFFTVVTHKHKKELFKWLLIF